MAQGIRTRFDGSSEWVVGSLEMCSMGGCGSSAHGSVEILVCSIAGNDLEIEAYLCDYHKGWVQALKVIAGLSGA